MCATIAAMAVQITRTQIATAIAAEISDIVSSFPFMNASSVGLVARQSESVSSKNSPRCLQLKCPRSSEP